MRQGPMSSPRHRAWHFQPVVEHDPEFQATGSIAGFRIDARVGHSPVDKNTKSAPHSPEQLIPQATLSEVAQLDESIPVHVVNLGPSKFHVRPFVRCDSPSGFDSATIVLVRVQANTVQALRSASPILASQLCEAEQKLSGDTCSLFDALGRPAERDEQLQEGRAYLLNNGLLRLPLDTSRLAWLASQGPKVAVDEMEFYLNIASTAFSKPWVRPMILQDLGSAAQIAEAWRIEVFGVLGDAGVVSAILVNDHWTPVLVYPAPRGKTRFVVSPAGAA